MSHVGAHTWEKIFKAFDKPHVLFTYFLEKPLKVKLLAQRDCVLDSHSCIYHAPNERTWKYEE